MNSCFSALTWSFTILFSVYGIQTLHRSLTQRHVKRFILSRANLMRSREFDFVTSAMAKATKIVGDILLAALSRRSNRLEAIYASTQNRQLMYDLHRIITHFTEISICDILVCCSSHLSQMKVAAPRYHVGGLPALFSHA